MQNVSFTSLIKPVSTSVYTREIESVYGKFGVNEPWTANETIKTPKAYTTNIADCTAGGITDGKDVVMFHICPTKPQNQDFDKIEKSITEKIDLKSPNLRGFLLGSVSMFEDSTLMFEKLKRIFDKNNIPLSFCKANKGSKTDIMYNSAKDEWLISNPEINNRMIRGNRDAKEILQNSFEQIHIADCDELTA